MKILRDIAARLERRAKAEGANELPPDDPPWLRSVLATLAAEIQATLQEAEEPAPPAPDYTHFDPKTQMISLADLAAIQRIGRDEGTRTTSLHLGLFDDIINGYRWLFGEHINDQRRIERQKEGADFLLKLNSELTDAIHRHLPEHTPFSGNGHELHQHDLKRVEAAGQRIARLERQLADIQQMIKVHRETFREEPPRQRPSESYCPGNCSRGGDGPPCGKIGCQG